MKYALALILALVSPAAFAVSIGIESLMSFVFYIIIVGLIFWLLWWLIGYAALPEPFAKVARIVLAVLAVFALINLLLGMAGTPFITFR